MNTETLYILPNEDRYVVREALRRAPASRVLIVLPWEADTGWDHPLDYEVIIRAAQERGLEVAWVVEDLAKRALPKKVGFPVFSNEAAAQTYLNHHGAFPKMRPPKMPRRPHPPWWRETPQPAVRLAARTLPWWKLILELGVLLIVLAIIGGFAFLTLPAAHIRLTPQTAVYTVVVPISVDPSREAGDVDLQRNLVPSHRIGDEFESYAETPTTGMSFSFSGKARGQVIFTNQLGQDYNVPRGTVVRTSAGSYPVRFVTTQDINVPAFGQMGAPVEAMDEGPGGNVGAYQINFVEGVVGFALRVTNPEPITGAESEEVKAVSEADQTHAWNLAAQQVMEAAYRGLQSGDYLAPGEFMPRQALVIQAVPKAAYTHLVGEQSPTLGVSLRLLVTGEVVNAADVQAVAFRHLAQGLPEGYTLVDTRFEYGEAAEEDIGLGRFTFYIKATGYAVTEINTGAVRTAIRGERLADAAQILSQSFNLAAPPTVTVEPEWFPYIPWLPMRTGIEVIASDQR